MITASQIITELENCGNAEKAAHLSGFFKTGKGQYGEGDRFLGVTVPEQRAVAKNMRRQNFRYWNNYWRLLSTNSGSQLC